MENYINKIKKIVKDIKTGILTITKGEGFPYPLFEIKNYKNKSVAYIQAGMSVPGKFLIDYDFEKNDITIYEKGLFYACYVNAIYIKQE